jgi:hypothetical protein
MYEPRLPRSARVVLAALVLLAAPAAAQQPVLSADTGSAWDVFGALRVRGESWNWFDETDRGRYQFLGATARIGVERRMGRQAFRFELAAPVLLGMPDDAFGDPADAANYGPGAGQLGMGATYRASNFDESSAIQLFPKNLHWRLMRRQLRATQALRIGRFEYDDGTETNPGNATLSALKRERIASRLLGSFAWTHVGRSYDGVHWSTKRDGRDVTLLVAAPTRGVFQADGWAPLPIGVAYGAWTVPYTTASGAADARVFGIQYLDRRDDPVRLTGNGAAQTLDDEDVTITTIGGHWLYVLERAPAHFDFVLWGAGQVGSWGNESHRAWSGVAEAGVQPRGMPSLNPWLRAGVAYGSGDDDAGDGRHGTFFQLLPTPRPYARFPFHNMQNLRDLYASLALRPADRVTIRSEVHSLALASAEDLWYLGGGAFQPRTFGYQGRTTGGERDLSLLVDLSADFRLTPDFVLSAYLSRASAGEAMRVAYPNNGAGSLFYVEVTRRF